MTCSTTTAYYARLTVTQGGLVFRSTHDLNAEVAGKPTNDETIAYLVDGLDGCLEDELDEGNSIDLKGMTPVQFATKLVNDEQFCIDELATEWDISTKWEKADPNNWDNSLS